MKNKICEEMHKLFTQALCAEMVRQNEEGTLQEAIKKQDNVKLFSYTALQNYTILQFWKLFDPKSIFNVNEVIKLMDKQKLTYWFDEKINLIKGDIKNLEIWRHNLVGHRSEFGYLYPEKFEEKFKDVNDTIKNNIIPFFVGFLHEMMPKIENVPLMQIVEKLRKEHTEFLKSLQRPDRSASI